VSSKSDEQVETSTNNVVTDRRLVLENGKQIVDSLVTDNSPEAIKAAIGPMVAAWQTMISGNNLNLFEVTQLGSDLVNQIDRSQVKINDAAYQTLKIGLAEFEGLLDQNQLTVDLVDDFATRSFDQSDRALEQSDRALELMAQVKTGGMADLSKTIMVFALLALYITSRGR
jgi:hypothetical protein